MPADSDLPRIQKGETFRQPFNDVVDAFNRLQRAYANDYFFGAPAGPRKLTEEFVGKTTSGSPGEAYTDERYWVDRIEVENIPLFSGDATAFPYDNQRVTATNLAELTATPSNGSHMLSEGTIVHVFATYDNSTPPARRYFFYCQPPVAIPVQLTSDGGEIGSKTTASTWTYTAKTITGGSIAGATGLSPLVAWRKGKLPAAQYGIGYFDTAGDFQLMVAFTTSGTGGC